jgi:hypothetical protein
MDRGSFDGQQVSVEMDTEVVGDIPVSGHRRDRKVRVKVERCGDASAVEMRTPVQGDHVLSIAEAKDLAAVLLRAVEVAQSE